MLLFHASLMHMIERHSKGMKMGDGCMPPRAFDCVSATSPA
jgi:hypothetical protein